MSDSIDLLVEGPYEAAEEHAKDDSVVNGIESAYLSERQFDELTERLIYITTDGMLPADALAASAKP